MSILSRKLFYSGTVFINGCRVTRIQPKSTYSRVGILGACFDQGQPHQGVGEAPNLIREAGLISKLKEKGFEVIDHGDISRPRVDGKRKQKDVLDFNRVVSEKVEKILGQDSFCLTLGGDHSIGLGTVAGHLAADPEAVVLWVDAHADINTVSSSNTGNMHGMPVSFNIKELQKENSKKLEGLEWLNPSLSPSRLAYIGLRDVEGVEWSYIQKFSIPCFPMQAIDRIGIVNAVESALNIVDPLKKRKIHMSFDIDVLDPAEAPATGTKVRGGLTLREALTLCEIVHDTGRLTGLDLVEVNPELATCKQDLDKTMEAALEVILAALGKP
ncbi:arginase-2, mitochondrial isoform X2 [Eurytemora carolleeae]|nr:arginase-2, mitochondrial isoform X2 [Eurytemora carolleeae]XP_023329871.1 arginase-2, mitochondrial isoform X2 [Eurytemora carolleeae]|eukprot:XP_023329870.1 arginase-2, mitochondrial-like isoform X2 [Eurytemora affinis]